MPKFYDQLFKIVSFVLGLHIVAGNTVLANDQSIILQSTTSTQNSGLFDYLLPKFKKQTGILVKVVAVGSGQALNNGRNGDGDVLLVHAKSAEEQFVAQGFGTKRFDVMYNDFIIIGPSNDPANLAGSSDILSALKKIATSKSIFASRGDDSVPTGKNVSFGKWPILM